MKRVFFTLLTVLLICSCVTSFAATKYLVLTTGGATGAYYMFGGEIASMLSATVEGVDIGSPFCFGVKNAESLAITGFEDILNVKRAKMLRMILKT